MKNILNSIYLIDPRISIIPVNEIQRLEKTMGQPLPIGYSEFMTSLGQGFLSGIVRLYPPGRIEEETNDFRTRTKENEYFWEGLSKKEACEGFLIADNIDGDQLVFLPPKVLVILPRHSGEVLYVVCLKDALARLAGYEIWPEIIDFCPFVKHKGLSFTRSTESISVETVSRKLADLKLHQAYLNDSDGSLQLEVYYFIEFFGQIIIEGDADEVRVQINYAPEKEDGLGAVLDCIKALGLMDPPEEPTEQELLENEVLVYVSLNYGHLAPPDQKCNHLSRTEPSPSQKRMARFIIANFGDQIFYNRCPNCLKLARTPRAARCFLCGANWPRPSCK